MKIPDIIRESWRMTVDHKYLVSLGTFASIFTLLLGVYRLRLLAPEPIFTLTDILGYFESHTDQPYVYFGGYLAVYGLIYLGFFLTNIIVEGGLIATIAKIKIQNVRLSFSRGLSLGMHSFLPLTEYRILTNLFNVGHIVLYFLFFRYYLRYFLDADRAAEILEPLWWVLLFVLVIVGIISVFLTYGEYSLVVYRTGVLKSIRKSITLVIFHLGETVLIMLLVSLIFLRAVINLVLIFLIPAFVGYLIVHFSTFMPFNILVAIGGIVTIVIFYFTARITGALYAFTTAVWTLTYLELEARKEYAILPGQEEQFDKDDDDS